MISITLCVWKRNTFKNFNSENVNVKTFINFFLFYSVAPTISTPCSDVKCRGQGEECVVDNRDKKTYILPMCKCINATNTCPSNEPVCANNNITYKSECHMNAAACASRKKLTVQHKGECKSCKSNACPI